MIRRPGITLAPGVLVAGVAVGAGIWLILITLALALWR